MTESRVAFAVLALCSNLGCAPQSADPAAAPMPAIAHADQRSFWNAIQALCGKAFAGKLAESNASDSVFARSVVVMHVRECSPGELRIPLHVGEDRSRTWVITPTASGLRLKHDHRHADGSEDAITQYGGDTRVTGSASKQEFHADSLTASLIPAARTNVWTIAIEPGKTFSYGLRRDGTDRRFRVEFDLTKPVTAPPPPWGHAASKPTALRHPNDTAAVRSALAKAFSVPDSAVGPRVTFRADTALAFVSVADGFGHVVRLERRTGAWVYVSIFGTAVR
jgi:hypothetical protein